jgi:hypothetical protein
MTRFLEAAFVFGWSLIGFAASMADTQGGAHLLELLSRSGPVLHCLKQ